MTLAVRKERGVPQKTARYAAVIAGLALLVVVLAVANLCAGSVAIAPDELFSVLGGADGASTSAQVVWAIRLPRLLSAGLLGGALALAGMLLQAFFNNPIAGPFILGISSGAKLAVAILMVLVVGGMGVVTSWMSVCAAAVGSLGVTALVLVVSRRIRTPSTLIVAGVMIGYVCNAATDFLVTFASDASIVNLRNWSLGSFSGASWDDVRVIAVVVLLASACVFALSKPLGAYQLGEAYAQSMGVHIRAFRVAIIGLSSLLAACVTAFAGPVSFVGIAVPHVTKRLLGTSKPQVVVPATFLGGASFCLLCDLVARTALAPTELQVSTVTAVLGAPVVMWVLLGRQRGVARRGENLGDSVRPGRSDNMSRSQAYGFAENGENPSVTHDPAHVAREHVLLTEDLSVGYGANAVVNHVRMTAKPGSVTTLVGPNGAGKSTILKTLGGRLAPLGGTVLLGGRRLEDWPVGELARERAVLLTDRVRTELLTCEDVVEMGRYPHTGRMGVLTRRDREAVRAAMELLHVDELRDCDFMCISDGQRQRVMLARAVCQEPRVLLLDEPMNHLDVRYQIELMGVLRFLAQERGLAIVASMHELSLARQVSDWLVCVHDGAATTQGTPEQVFVPDVIDALFELEPGTFDPLTGHIELRAAKHVAPRSTIAPSSTIAPWSTSRLGRREQTGDGEQAGDGDASA